MDLSSVTRTSPRLPLSLLGWHSLHHARWLERRLPLACPSVSSAFVPWFLASTRTFRGQSARYRIMLRSHRCPPTHPARGYRRCIPVLRQLPVIGATWPAPLACARLENGQDRQQAEVEEEPESVSTFFLFSLCPLSIFFLGQSRYTTGTSTIRRASATITWTFILYDDSEKKLVPLRWRIFGASWDIGENLSFAHFVCFLGDGSLVCQVWDTVICQVTSWHGERSDESLRFVQHVAGWWGIVWRLITVRNFLEKCFCSSSNRGDWYAFFFSNQFPRGNEETGCVSNFV